MSPKDTAFPGTPDFTREPDRFGEIGCRSDHGLHRMVYADWGPLDAETVVVCVHGLTRQGRDFDPVAAALADEGVRVICPDLPGRGRSEPLPNILDDNLARYRDDLLRLLAELGDRPVHWIGTSLGGLLGIILAGSGAPISRLVVNDIGPEVPTAASTRVIFKHIQAPTSFASLATAENFFRTKFAAYGELSDAHWRHITRHSTSEQPNGRYRWLFDPRIGFGFHMARSPRLDLWAEWRSIAAPILILRGVQSEFLSAGLAREMLDTNRGARIHEVEGVGHMPMLATATEIRTILDFLLRP